MTDGRHSGVTERQRGFLGAVLLMLALVVGQFVTLERKISVRSASDPAVTRTAAERAEKRAAVPRPLSAGGGTSSSDSWLLSGNGTERRAAKAKPAGAGGDPSFDFALLGSDQFAPFARRSETRTAIASAEAVPAGTPRHDFDGRAPPARLL
jgi:hypothetical protein